MLNTAYNLLFEQQERRAAETAKQTLSKKSQKVHAERSQKEKLHREKMKQ